MAVSVLERKKGRVVFLCLDEKRKHCLRVCDVDRNAGTAKKNLERKRQLKEINIQRVKGGAISVRV